MKLRSGRTYAPKKYIGRKRRVPATRRGPSVSSQNRGSDKMVTMQNTFQNPVPDTIKATLRYFENNLTIDPTVGGLAANYVFSANGLYDPNITGVGHQPLSFDQYMAMYDHFTVIGSKITVFARNGDESYGQMVGVRYSDSATVESDPRTLIENGRCVYRLMDEGDESDACSVSMGLNIGKVLGRKSVLDEDDLRGGAGGNPAEQAYWHVFAFPDSAVDSGAIRFSVQIDYIAVFSEPKLLALS